MELTVNNIELNKDFKSKQEAINFVGNKLHACGYVELPYIEGMHKRDQQVSVYMGNDLAIPHGSDDYREYIKQTGIVIVQVPKGVDFDGNNVRLLIGIAAAGNDHMDILSNIAILCSEQEIVDQLVATDDKQQIIKMIEEGE